MEYRTSENPAQWKGGALPHLLPATGKISKVEHRKVVPYQDVPKLMVELRKNGSISAKALMFTILTGARTTETREATDTEIDRTDGQEDCGGHSQRCAARLHDA